MEKGTGLWGWPARVPAQLSAGYVMSDKLLSLCDVTVQWRDDSRPHDGAARGLSDRTPTYSSQRGPAQRERFPRYLHHGSEIIPTHHSLRTERGPL